MIFYKKSFSPELWKFIIESVLSKGFIQKGEEKKVKAVVIEIQSAIFKI